MKPNPIFSCWIILLLSTGLSAQESKREKRKLTHVGIAFTNSHTAMPFGSLSKLITGNHHPGVEFSTGLIWKSKPRHNWIQTFNAGYSYHRWVQHSLLLYSEIGYRYKFPAGFFAEAKLGGGYMRAIITTETFAAGVKEGQQYGKILSGRSHGIASLGFGIGKKIKAPYECNLFMEYQQRVQTPFIQSYVPLLPYNILKVGITLPIKH